MTAVEKKKQKFGKDLIKMAEAARAACRSFAGISADKKNSVLKAMAEGLRGSREKIAGANALDVRAANRRGLPKALIDRLFLDEKRISEMAASLEEIAKLPDPVGREIKSWTRPNGLQIVKVGVPLGVILIVYESRPNVTSDCAGLCFKSGNAVILRGGSDATSSNACIHGILCGALADFGLPEDLISFVKTPDRRAVDVLLALDEYIDLVMPRGGESLIREVKKKSSIPVIKHHKGVCHVYVDASADFAMAQRIILNAKVQRPAVCNAAETLLVHESIARDFLPTMSKALRDAGVEIRADAATRKFVKGLKCATEEDWFTEYLDLILSVKIVKNVDEAIAHINHYGSGHSDAIVSSDEGAIARFLRDVDSACVYANASTRFTDGYQFGFGAEIGISTDRLHARGPMGLEELTTYKYVIRGNGQIRE